MRGRAQRVPVGPTEVRILGPEDQLRHLSLHLLRHGAWRPLWLCDVAAALESLPPDFDWDYCLSGDRCLTDWVICAIGLAQRLLQARVGQPDIAGRAAELPRWLETTVLALWGAGAESNDTVRQPFAACLGSWTALRQALRRRWPNPIRAAFKLGCSPFIRWPLPALRLLAFLVRAGRYAGRSPARTSTIPLFDVHARQVR